jgi:hypothetical protein
MSVTYSVSATLTRATQFDRNVFRTMGLTSGSATKEFSATADLTTIPLPTFPILVNTPDVTQINFLVIQVTGGTAKIRLTQANQTYNNIDLNLSGTTIMSGIELTQVTILGTPTGQCYIECFGMGN